MTGDAAWEISYLSSPLGNRATVSGVGWDWTGPLCKAAEVQLLARAEAEHTALCFASNTDCGIPSVWGEPFYSVLCPSDPRGP